MSSFLWISPLTCSMLSWKVSKIHPKSRFYRAMQSNQANETSLMSAIWSSMSLNLVRICQNESMMLDHHCDYNYAAKDNNDTNSDLHAMLPRDFFAARSCCRLRKGIFLSSTVVYRCGFRKEWQKWTKMDLVQVLPQPFLSTLLFFSLHLRDSPFWSFWSKTHTFDV